MHCIYVGREATMPLTYHLRLSARARKLRVAIYTDGACIVTAPRRMPFEYVERFLKEKSTWLADKINFVRNNEWAEKLGVDGVDSHARTRQSKLAMRKEYTDLKAAAYTIAATRLKHFNTIYKLPIGKITIRNQKSRWGSCSRKGNLNFNYKIACALV